MLAGMTIPMQYILPDVPETKHISLLVFFSLDFWTLDFLNVEVRYLDDYLEEQHRRFAMTDRW